MQIHLETGDRSNLIRSYGPGRIVVGETAYTSSLIVLPNRLITDWPPQTMAAMAREHLQVLVELDYEVLILGTGHRLRFPPATLLAPLAAAGSGYEIMDTGAACRTYNILMAEGRRVIAALLPIVDENR